jgi:type IV pilus assembly protein PilE
MIHRLTISNARTRRVAAARGFTLIEVMIVVSIVAILAAVALPAYFDSVRKARRADAINAITKAQQAQERYRGDNANYGNAIANAGTATMAAASAVSNNSFDSADSHYSVGYTAPTNASPSSTAYVILAVAKSTSSQASDKNCQCLELRMLGGQATYAAGGTSGTFNGTAAACGTIASGAAANRCWRK